MSNNQEAKVLNDMKSDDFFKFIHAWSPIPEVEIYEMVVDLHNLLVMERQKARKEAFEEAVLAAYEAESPKDILENLQALIQ